MDPSSWDFLTALGDWPLGPELIQCPGSNAHVWDMDQCARFNIGGGGRGGGAAGGRGLLGRIISGLTGGLL